LIYHKIVVVYSVFMRSNLIQEYLIFISCYKVT